MHSREDSFASPLNPQVVDARFVVYAPSIAHLVNNSSFAYLPFMDREDIAQEAALKFLLALRTKDITNVSGYLRSTVFHESVNYKRRLLRWGKFLPLLLTEDGGVQGECEHKLAPPEQGMNDPQIEVEQHYSFYKSLDTVVRVIVQLPYNQKRVAVCLLRDRFDNPVLLAEAFLRYGLDIETLQWPQDAKAKQTLRASYAQARKKLAAALKIDLALFQ